MVYQRKYWMGGGYVSWVCVERGGIGLELGE